MSNSSSVKIALIGVGGYAGNFVQLLCSPNTRPDVEFVAAVDPKPEVTGHYPALVDRKIPLFPTMDAMYAAMQPAIVVVSSPIHLHAEQTIAALQRGSHVLCEKPLGCSIEQVKAMIAARNAAGKQAAIGYQWNFSPAIQSAKSDILSGKLGKPRRVSGLCLYPRTQAYFNRASWAGRKTDASGKPIYDSPVNNACAHFLQILLYMLGDAPDRSAIPAEVTAELYRANPIENYDTGCLRCITRDGVEVLFLTSHSTPRTRGPLLRFEFEHGTISYDETSGKGILAEYSDGQQRYFGIASSGMTKLWRFIDAVRDGTHVFCPLEAAAVQTYAMAAAQQSEIVNFPDSAIDPRDNGTFRVIHGLEELLMRCWDAYKLPSEIGGVSWAKPAKTTKVSLALPPNQFE